MESEEYKHGTYLLQSIVCICIVDSWYIAIV